MNTTFVVVALVLALALLGVVAVTIVAEAAQPPGRGCEFTPGGNASKTRCVHLSIIFPIMDLLHMPWSV